jgi:hypothetical protein
VNGVRAEAFRPNHPWDRNFFLLMVALGWVGIVMGFGGSIARHLSTHAAPYPLIIHFHGAVFVGWLVFFTIQILLIRSSNLAAHRRLGMAMGWVALGMALLGPATALTVQHRSMGEAGANPGFLSIQFTDILAFITLTLAGISLRRDPSAHKRLVLLGTLYITDAGFARRLSGGLAHRVGVSFWGLWTAIYLAPVLLMALVGAYDLVTRRRLNVAYSAGIAWVLALQMGALALYRSPSWTELAKRLIAHWP